MIRITKSEINALVYEYLQQNGLSHTAFMLKSEGNVYKGRLLSTLTEILCKGMQFLYFEHHFERPTTTCQLDFSLNLPHFCTLSDQQAAEAQIDRFLRESGDHIANVLQNSDRGPHERNARAQATDQEKIKDAVHEDNKGCDGIYHRPEAANTRQVQNVSSLKTQITSQGNQPSDKHRDETDRNKDDQQAQKRAEKGKSSIKHEKLDQIENKRNTKDYIDQPTAIAHCRPAVEKKIHQDDKNTISCTESLSKPQIHDVCETPESLIYMNNQSARKSCIQPSKGNDHKNSFNLKFSDKHDSAIARCFDNSKTHQNTLERRAILNNKHTLHDSQSLQPIQTDRIHDQSIESIKHTIPTAVDEILNDEEFQNQKITHIDSQCRSHSSANDQYLTHTELTSKSICGNPIESPHHLPKNFTNKTAQDFAASQTLTEEKPLELYLSSGNNNNRMYSAYREHSGEHKNTNYSYNNLKPNQQLLQSSSQTPLQTPDNCIHRDELAINKSMYSKNNKKCLDIIQNVSEPIYTKETIKKPSDQDISSNVSSFCVDSGNKGSSEYISQQKLIQGTKEKVEGFNGVHRKKFAHQSVETNGNITTRDHSKASSDLSDMPSSQSTHVSCTEASNIGNPSFHVENSSKSPKGFFATSPNPFSITYGDFITNNSFGINYHKSQMYSDGSTKPKDSHVSVKKAESTRSQPSNALLCLENNSIGNQRDNKSADNVLFVNQSNVSDQRCIYYGVILDSTVAGKNVRLTDTKNDIKDKNDTNIINARCDLLKSNISTGTKYHKDYTIHDAQVSQNLHMLPDMDPNHTNSRFWATNTKTDNTLSHSGKETLLADVSEENSFNNRKPPVNTMKDIHSTLKHTKDGKKSDKSVILRNTSNQHFQIVDSTCQEAEKPQSKQLTEKISEMSGDTTIFSHSRADLNASNQISKQSYCIKFTLREKGVKSAWKNRLLSDALQKTLLKQTYSDSGPFKKNRSTKKKSSVDLKLHFSRKGLLTYDCRRLLQSKITRIYRDNQFYTRKSSHVSTTTNEKESTTTINSSEISSANLRINVFLLKLKADTLTFCSLNFNGDVFEQTEEYKKYNTFKKSSQPINTVSMTQKQLENHQRLQEVFQYFMEKPYSGEKVKSDSKKLKNRQNRDEKSTLSDIAKICDGSSHMQTEPHAEYCKSEIATANLPSLSEPPPKAASSDANSSSHPSLEYNKIVINDSVNPEFLCKNKKRPIKDLDSHHYLCKVTKDSGILSQKKSAIENSDDLRNVDSLSRNPAAYNILDDSNISRRRYLDAQDRCFNQKGYPNCKTEYTADLDHFRDKSEEKAVFFDESISIDQIHNKFDSVFDDKVNENCTEETSGIQTKNYDHISKISEDSFHTYQTYDPNDFYVLSKKNFIKPPPDRKSPLNPYTFTLLESSNSQHATSFLYKQNRFNRLEKDKVHRANSSDTPFFSTNDFKHAKAGFVSTYSNEEAIQRHLPASFDFRNYLYNIESQVKIKDAGSNFAKTQKSLSDGCANTFFCGDPTYQSSRIFYDSSGYKKRKVEQASHALCEKSSSEVAFKSSHKSKNGILPLNLQNGVNKIVSTKDAKNNLSSEISPWKLVHITNLSPKNESHMENIHEKSKKTQSNEVLTTNDASSKVSKDIKSILCTTTDGKVHCSNFQSSQTLKTVESLTLNDKPVADFTNSHKRDSEFVSKSKKSELPLLIVQNALKSSPLSSHCKNANQRKNILTASQDHIRSQEVSPLIQDTESAFGFFHKQTIKDITGTKPIFTLHYPNPTLYFETSNPIDIEKNIQTLRNIAIPSLLTKLNLKGENTRKKNQANQSVGESCYQSRKKTLTLADNKHQNEAVSTTILKKKTAKSAHKLKKTKKILLESATSDSPFNQSLLFDSSHDGKSVANYAINLNQPGSLNEIQNSQSNLNANIDERNQSVKRKSASLNEKSIASVESKLIHLQDSMPGTDISISVPTRDIDHIIRNDIYSKEPEDDFIQTENISENSLVTKRKYKKSKESANATKSKRLGDRKKANFTSESFCMTANTSKSTNGNQKITGNNKENTLDTIVSSISDNLDSCKKSIQNAVVNQECDRIFDSQRHMLKFKINTCNNEKSATSLLENSASTDNIQNTFNKKYIELKTDLAENLNRPTSTDVSFDNDDYPEILMFRDGSLASLKGSHICDWYQNGWIFGNKNGEICILNQQSRISKFFCESEVTTVASNQKNEIVVGTFDGELYKIEMHDIKKLRRKHNGPVTACTFSESDQILTVGFDGMAIITDHEQFKLKIHQNPIIDCDWADKDTFITASTDFNLSLCSVSRKKVRLLKGHYGVVNSVSALNGVLSSTADDGLVILYNTHIKASAHMIGHKSPVLCQAWLDQGRTLFTGGSEKSCIHWDVPTATCLQRFETSKNATYSIVSLSENTVVCSSDNCLLNIVDTRVGSIRKISLGSNSLSVKFNEKTLQLATCLYDEVPKVFDFRNLEYNL